MLVLKNYRKNGDSFRVVKNGDNYQVQILSSKKRWINHHVMKMKYAFGIFLWDEDREDGFRVGFENSEVIDEIVRHSKELISIFKGPDKKKAEAFVSILELELLALQFNRTNERIFIICSYIYALVILKHPKTKTEFCGVGFGKVPVDELEEDMFVEYE